MSAVLVLAIRKQVQIYNANCSGPGTEVARRRVGLDNRNLDLPSSHRKVGYDHS